VYAKSAEDGLDTAGFVLIDSSFRPVYANPESIQILSYPNGASNPVALDGILTQKIVSFLPKDLDLVQGAAVTQFQSGRRNYSCRAFLLEDHWNGEVRETRVALLFERGLSGPPAALKNQRRLAGMSEDAFSFAPDPRYFCFSRAHKEVFSSIRGMVRDRLGIGVVLAQAGMGKTALLEYLLKTLRPESEIARMPGSFETHSDLVRGLIGLFGLDGRGRDLAVNLQYLENWLASRRQEGRLVTLICDDAQDLSIDMLENICHFSDMKVGEQRLLQVVLAGRQGLLEKLTGVRLEAAAAKIHVYSRLAPLDEAEVCSYVIHRLKTAGCKRPLFTSAALSSIALYSRGIPLNINMLCRHSISLAATLNVQTIDERIVADSAYDLVLRAQPASFADGASGETAEPQRQSGLARDRRGLKLVEKSNL
jgi:type II secretory pathway predicted ATPase ExeA